MDTSQRHNAGVGEAKWGLRHRHRAIYVNLKTHKTILSVITDNDVCGKGMCVGVINTSSTSEEGESKRDRRKEPSGGWALCL